MTEATEVQAPAFNKRDLLAARDYVTSIMQIAHDRMNQTAPGVSPGAQVLIDAEYDRIRDAAFARIDALADAISARDSAQVKTRLVILHDSDGTTSADSPVTYMHVEKQ